MKNSVLTIVLGFLFGSVLIASDAFSWIRIQEMFHFKSFHMYGLLFSAIATAAISIMIIKKWKIKSISGNEIVVKPKKLDLKASIFGGTIFGIGWGITGACSAPLFILIGIKWQIGGIILAGAILGTIVYALTLAKSVK